jgi:hypothetical protein
MNNRLMRIAITSLVALLGACGTTSNIQPAARADSNPKTAVPVQTGKPLVDLAAYDTVAVLDFRDATDKSKIKPEKLQAYSDTVATATRSFADLIAQKVRESGAFPTVVRGPATGRALVVSGSITRLVEGNSALRLLVGMGAGSSYFEANTELSDGESGQSLGRIATDKNSWALGGGIAAGQTVESFMQGAATKIAQQLRQNKQGLPVAKSH